MATTTREGRRIELRGTVQGVGVCPWIYRVAHEYGITGRVWNHASGVTVDAFADVGTLDRFIAALRATPPPAAVIAVLESDSLAVEDLNDFVIVRSTSGLERRVSIPPDLATCRTAPPRSSIPPTAAIATRSPTARTAGRASPSSRDVPYDRPATTMAPFVMCPACQREYDDPTDRRFHAQPNACPVCGPQLTSCTRRTATASVADDAIALPPGGAARGLHRRVKGIGGFQLACDATSRDAVPRLRARKHREEKPLAVMVRDLGAARRDRRARRAEAQRLLTSAERPIVLVAAARRRAARADVAPGQPAARRHAAVHAAASPAARRRSACRW